MSKLLDTQTLKEISDFPLDSHGCDSITECCSCQSLFQLPVIETLSKGRKKKSAIQITQRKSKEKKGIVICQSYSTGQEQKPRATMPSPVLDLLNHPVTGRLSSSF